MKMKKTMMILIAALMCTIPMTGCGENTTEESESSETKTRISRSFITASSRLAIPSRMAFTFAMSQL